MYTPKLETYSYKYISDIDILWILANTYTRSIRFIFYLKMFFQILSYSA
jgi:hypothetical protein